ncbi:MAG: hypothetical protein KGI52_16355 [Burkholderiales bacterium]|nr:hypothetical protein [Burkholderiales bacterium]
MQNAMVTILEERRTPQVGEIALRVGQSITAQFILEEMISAGDFTEGKYRTILRGLIAAGATEASKVLGEYVKLAKDKIASAGKQASEFRAIVGAHWFAGHAYDEAVPFAKSLEQAREALEKAGVLPNGNRRSTEAEKAQARQRRAVKAIMDDKGVTALDLVMNAEMAQELAKAATDKVLAEASEKLEQKAKKYAETLQSLYPDNKDRLDYLALVCRHLGYSVDFKEIPVEAAVL